MSKKILLTFAGSTDPTRGQHDGPILHICRNYRPEKIYLILTHEMSERDAEPYNIYERAIKENLKGYAPEIIKIHTNIKDAHLFEVYFNDIYNTFEKIKNENINPDVYVNISSGTPQLIGSLISYMIDAININIIPIQVSTPVKESNSAPIVTKSYNVEEEAKKNIDNKNDSKNRIIIPDLKQYSRVLVKNQIKELLNQYKYEAIVELLKRNIFKNNFEISSLVNYAIDRKNLKGSDSNKWLIPLIDKSKYENITYKKIDGKDDWYKIVDYFALANIKQKTNDLNIYTLMLEPLTVKIYLSILEDILKLDLNNIFKNSRDGKIGNLDKDLKLQLEKKLGYTIKSDSYISFHILSEIIKYYLEKLKNKKISLNNFLNFNNTLKNYKDIRNLLAHSLKIITKEDFKNKTEVSIQKINTSISNFFKTYYTEYGYKTNMINVYDEVNKFINEILEKEIC